MSEDSSAVRFISSNPKHWQWYHKIVIVIASAAFAGIGYLACVSIAAGDWHPRNVKTILNLGIAFVVCAGYLYREVVGTVIFEYDAHALLRRNEDTQLTTPFPYSGLARVIRRSPACVLLQAPTEESGFPLTFKNQNFKVIELTVRGNDDDIDAFCETMRRAGVAITDDGMGDDPPEKTAAMLFIALFCLGVVVAGVVFIARYAR